MPESAADRVRVRVRALLDKPGRSQRKLADALKRAGIEVDHSELSRKLSKDPRKQRDFTLRQIDAVAQYLGVPPALLIQRDTSALQELNEDEARLVVRWREWPEDIQQHVLPLLDYFAGLLPEQKEERRIWSKLRKLSPSDREYVERTIDDVRRARRIERETGGAPAAQASSDGTTGPASTPEKRRRLGR